MRNGGRAARIGLWGATHLGDFVSLHLLEEGAVGPRVSSRCLANGERGSKRGAEGSRLNAALHVEDRHSCPAGRLKVGHVDHGSGRERVGRERERQHWAHGKEEECVVRGAEWELGGL